MHVKTGIEAEFFLLTPAGDADQDAFDTAAKPCYDQQAFMRRLDVIRRSAIICWSWVGAPTRTTTKTPMASGR